ncbi:MAG: tetratricopeptide repeat protein [Polyangiaceae bacterium]|nr:tetratricopeptide repeat protein [Polyangiaceae bacterium]
MVSRRSKEGGAKKRPTRYDDGPTSPALADALRHHRKGHFGEAIVGYRAVLADSPSNLDALVNLGAACVSLGRAQEAEAAYREVVVRARDARAARDAGIGLASIGRFDLARTALQASVASDPSLTGAFLFLSRCCAALGDRVGSIEAAHAAVRAAPCDASAHHELHRALFDDRDPGASIPAAERAVELDPDWSFARIALAGALALDGRDDASRSALVGIDERSAGAADALAYMLSRRAPSTRFFANARDTLLHALDQARTPGVVLELGVRHGISTRILAEHARGVVRGFDSFVGLPEAWHGLPAGAFSTSGELPELPANVELHVGWFDDTLPAYCAAFDEPLRLVHIDSDLYTSAKIALDQLGPRITSGTIVVFDEYTTNAAWRQDEFRAFREACETFGWSYEYVSCSWFTGQAVVRIA